MRLVAARGAWTLAGGGEKREEGMEGMRYFLVLFFFLPARFSLSLGSGRGACGEGRSRDMYEVVLGAGEGGGGGSVTKYIPPSIHPHRLPVSHSRLRRSSVDQLP